MQLEAFAKINWSLDICGVREDGYHLMDMIMQPISLCDDIILLPASDLSITTGGFPPSRADESNLAMKAARALQRCAKTSQGARIHLYKRIPMGAGLGGGSADAAAVLIGLNRMWKTGLSETELASVGLSVGADVPFCLSGGLKRVRGIGEEMEEYPCRLNYWLLVFQPCRGLSTKIIFESYDASRVRHPDTENALLALKEANLPLLEKSIGNVLEPVSAALRPEIDAAISRLHGHGALISAMSGSGSAVFGVFSSRENALKAKDILSREYRHIHLCHTQSDSIRFSEDEAE